MIKRLKEKKDLASFQNRFSYKCMLVLHNLQTIAIKKMRSSTQIICRLVKYFLKPKNANFLDSKDDKVNFVFETIMFVLSGKPIYTFGRSKSLSSQDIMQRISFNHNPFSCQKNQCFKSTFFKILSMRMESRQDSRYRGTKCWREELYVVVLAFLSGFRCTHTHTRMSACKKTCHQAMKHKNITFISTKAKKQTDSHGLSFFFLPLLFFVVE